MFATERKWAKQNSYYTKAKKRRPGDQLLMIQQSYERTRSKRQFENTNISQRQWPDVSFSPMKFSPEKPEKAYRYQEDRQKETALGLLVKFAGGGNRQVNQTQASVRNYLQTEKQAVHFNRKSLGTNHLRKGPNGQALLRKNKFEIKSHLQQNAKKYYKELTERPGESRKTDPNESMVDLLKQQARRSLEKKISQQLFSQSMPNFERVQKNEAKQNALKFEKSEFRPESKHQGNKKNPAAEDMSKWVEQLGSTQHYRKPEQMKEQPKREYPPPPPPPIPPPQPKQTPKAPQPPQHQIPQPATKPPTLKLTEKPVVQVLHQEQLKEKPKQKEQEKEKQKGKEKTMIRQPEKPSIKQSLMRKNQQEQSFPDMKLQSVVQGRTQQLKQKLEQEKSQMKLQIPRAMSPPALAKNSFEESDFDSIMDIPTLKTTEPLQNRTRKDSTQKSQDKNSIEKSQKQKTQEKTPQNKDNVVNQKAVKGSRDQPPTTKPHQQPQPNQQLQPNQQTQQSQKTQQVPPSQFKPKPAREQFKDDDLDDLESIELQPQSKVIQKKQPVLQKPQQNPKPLQQPPQPQKSQFKPQQSQMGQFPQLPPMSLIKQLQPQSQSSSFPKKPDTNRSNKAPQQPLNKPPLQLKKPKYSSQQVNSFVQNILTHQDLVNSLGEYHKKAKNVYNGINFSWIIVAYQLYRKFVYEREKMKEAINNGKNCFKLNNMEVPDDALSECVKNQEVEKMNEDLNELDQRVKLELEKLWQKAEAVEKNIPKPGQSDPYLDVRKALSGEYRFICAQPISKQNGTLKERLVYVMEFLFINELFGGHFIKQYEQPQQIQDIDGYLLKYKKKADELLW